MESNNWYKKCFGEDYLKIYDHRNDAEAEKDIGNIITLTGAEKDWAILDLCCGAGRHLRALYRAGYRKLCGLDLSEHLLKKAKEYSNGRRIPFIQGDNRHIPFDRSFDLVMSLFTSFGYFFSDEENLEVLREVNKVMKSGGLFLLDHINKAYLEKNLVPEDTIYKHGKEIVSKRWISPDGLRVEKEMTVNDGKKKKIYRESVRLFTPYELGELLKKAGFVNINYYCGTTCGPLTEKSQRLIIVGAKND